MLFTFAGGAVRAEVPHPRGIWELAADHVAPFPVTWMVGGDALFWVSDQKTGVAAMQRTSGEVTWGRRVPDGAPWRGVWVADEVVIVASDAARSYQASDGAKRWEKPLGCNAATCALTLLGVEANHILAARTASGGAGDASEVVCFEAASGRELWAQAVPGVVRRGVLGPTWVAVEVGGATFGLRFFGRANGAPLGSWEGHTGRAADALGVVVARGGVARFDLRPGSGRLAEIALVTPSGEAPFVRVIDSTPLGGDTAQVAWASADGAQAALFVPALGPRPAALVLAGWDGAQRVESLRGAGEPVRVGARVLLSVAGSWRLFAAAGKVLSTLDIPGSSPAARVFALGERAAIVDGDAVVTLAEGLGAADVEGFGAPNLRGSEPNASVAAVAAVGPARSELLVARGDRVAHLVLIPIAKARDELTRGVAAGGDAGPLMHRLARFGPWLAPLQSAMPASTEVPVLQADQASLNASFRRAWLGGDAQGVLEGAAELYERLGDGPAERPRRETMLDGLALLMLDLVVGPGAAPRSPDAAAAVLALARTYAHASDAVERVPAAIWATTAAIQDDPLAAADVLARLLAAPAAGPDPIVKAAQTELVRRALYALRTSAGALKTDTSRQMLVGGLRFFRWLDVALGAADAEKARALFDGAEAEEDIAHELDALLARAEGPVVTKKGLGPAMCGLACEAAAAVCGSGEEGECAERCQKMGGVRFVGGARAGSDPRWFCPH